MYIWVLEFISQPMQALDPEVDSGERTLSARMEECLVLNTPVREQQQ